MPRLKSIWYEVSYRVEKGDCNQNGAFQSKIRLYSVNVSPKNGSGCAAMDLPVYNKILYRGPWDLDLVKNIFLCPIHWVPLGGLWMEEEILNVIRIRPRVSFENLLLIKCFDIMVTKSALFLFFSLLNQYCRQSIELTTDFLLGFSKMDISIHRWK